VAEPGLLCVALLQDGQWKSVRSVKVGPDWAAELHTVMAREECMVETELECDRIVVYAPDLPEPVLPQSGRWRIEYLVSRSALRANAGTPAPHSIAIGA
jgi:hypothetical protein